MVKNIFATIGILAVLLLSLGMVSAISGTTTENGITMTVSETALTDVTTGETYDFTVTIVNANGTDYNVSFGTSGWAWDKEGITVANGATETFIGTLTIGTTQSKSVIAKFYDMTDPILKLFEIKETVSLSYLPILGCTDPAANNTDPAANTDDGSCTYDPIEGCTDPAANNYDSTATTDDGSCTYNTPTTDFEFCNWNGTAGFTNGTEIVIKGFSDEQLDNKDEWEWKPLDNIEIEVDVKNVGEDDEDYIVEIVFLDSLGNIVDVAEDDKNLEEEVSIDEGDTETVVFTFEVDGDVDDGNNYYMHIKVYQDGDEDEQCISLAESEVERIDIIKERHDVLVKKVEGPNSVEAGSQVLYEVRVANLGREDQDMVKIIVSNPDLGILMTREIENLDEGDSEVLTFSVNFPDEAEEKLYKIRFSTEFNYDEDDEIYEDVSDSGDDILYQVTVLGGEHTTPTISASLDSEAKVGEELVITATIINNGEDDNFDITVTGYESWAELVSISPQALSLDKDEEGTVIIQLIPRYGGVQTFKVNAIYNGEAHDQAVSVSITEDEKEGLFADVNKTVLYSVAGIAALVILIFLTLIVKISRRSKKVPQF